jgi:hypothetical protein
MFLYQPRHFTIQHATDGRFSSEILAASLNKKRTKLSSIRREEEALRRR